VKLLQQTGGHVWVAEAPDWTGSGASHLNIAVHLPTVMSRASRGLTWQLGQMYGVVGTGLIMTRHVYKGLKRDMYVREDKDAAAKKLVATWAAPRDAELVGEEHNSYLSYVDAPAGRVFAVYISPNEMLTDFPDIHGWAEHWAWIAADPSVAGAPIDWNSRYDSRVWSSPGS
jgi:hypothetical protein